MMVFILRCECRKEMFCMENTRNKKTKAQKKGLITGLLLLTVFVLAGCYSPEEKALEKKYKKQAKVNAVNYIKDKYGFSATVKSASVQPGGNDFGIVDPHPTRLVFVTMEYALIETNIQCFMLSLMSFDLRYDRIVSSNEDMSNLILLESLIIQSNTK